MLYDGAKECRKKVKVLMLNVSFPKFYCIFISTEHVLENFMLYYAGVELILDASYIFPH